MEDYALVLNAGSSSLKFCVFQRPEGEVWRVAARGQIDGIGTKPRLSAKDGAGTQVADQPLDVFIAGDDADAKETVAGLARDGGLNPIDTGPLRRARELERLGFLHMALQDSLGTGYGSTIKLLS